MFLFGMLIVFSTLIYILVTNNERLALYIFGISSIAYFVFGYGIPLNEMNLLVSETNIIYLIFEVLTILSVFYLIKRFESTVFMKDYNLVLRSFFFRFETMTLALYLIGILISSGNIIIDFLILVACMRLFKVDKFISYIVVNAVLFTNALFIYPTNNLLLVDPSIGTSDLLHTSSVLVAIIIPSFMLILYFAGFLVRSLEKDIVVEFKIIGIIILTAVVGMLGVASLSSTQLLIYLPIMTIILLYLNDLNVRKKFSRYSQIPITVSILILCAFIITIYISKFSFLLFIICSILINSVLLTEKYQVTEVSYVEQDIDPKTLITAVIVIFLMTIFANYSVYNATTIGVPYIEAMLNAVMSGGSNLLSRTYLLYTNAAYFGTMTPTYIDPNMGINNIQYLIIAIPALSVIAIPMQLLIISATGYKTKISGEILIGVIMIGLVTLTLVSYAIGA